MRAFMQGCSVLMGMLAVSVCTASAVGQTLVAISALMCVAQERAESGLNVWRQDGYAAGKEAFVNDEQCLSFERVLFTVQGEVAAYSDLPKKDGGVVNIRVIRVSVTMGILVRNNTIFTNYYAPAKTLYWVTTKSAVGLEAVQRRSEMRSR